MATSIPPPGGGRGGGGTATTTTTRRAPRTIAKTGDFAQRVYNMIQECQESRPDICSWVETEDDRRTAGVEAGVVFSGFLVRKVQALVDGYFKTYEFVNRNTGKPTTFVSFQRQLNNYGFSVRSPDGCVKVVRHEKELFLRGREDLLHLINKSYNTGGSSHAAAASASGAATTTTTTMAAPATTTAALATSATAVSPATAVATTTADAAAAVERPSPPVALERKPSVTARSLQSTVLGLQSAMYSQTNRILKVLNVPESELSRDPLLPPPQMQPAVAPLPAPVPHGIVGGGGGTATPTVATPSPQYHPTQNNQALVAGAAAMTSSPVHSANPLSSFGTATTTASPPPPPLGTMDPSPLYYPPQTTQPQQQQQPQQQRQLASPSQQHVLPSHTPPPQQEPLRMDAYGYSSMSGSLQDFPLQGPHGQAQMPTIFDEADVDFLEHTEDEDEEILEELKGIFDSDKQIMVEDDDSLHKQGSFSRKRRGEEAGTTNAVPGGPNTSKDPWQAPPKKPKKKTLMTSHGGTAMDNRDVLKPRWSKTRKNRKQQQQQQQNGGDFPETPAIHEGEYEGAHDEYDDDERMEEWEGGPPMPMQYLHSQANKKPPTRRRPKMEAAQAPQDMEQHRQQAIMATTTLPKAPSSRVAPRLQFMVLALLVILVLLQISDIILSTVQNSNKSKETNESDQVVDANLCPEPSLLDVERLSDSADVVVDVSLSLDGTVAAVLGRDSLEIWDVKDRGEFSRVQAETLSNLFGGNTTTTTRGLDVALSGNGRVVVVATVGGLVSVYRVPSLQRVWEGTGPGLPSSEADAGKSWVAIDEDGFWVVVSGPNPDDGSVPVIAMVRQNNPNDDLFQEEEDDDSFDDSSQFAISGKGVEAAVAIWDPFVATLSLVDDYERVQFDFQKRTEGSLRQAAPPIWHSAFGTNVRVALGDNGNVVALVRRGDGDDNKPVVMVLELNVALGTWEMHPCGDLLELPLAGSAAEVVSLEWTEDASQLMVSQTLGSWHVWHRVVVQDADSSCRWQRTKHVHGGGTARAFQNDKVVTIFPNKDLVGIYQVAPCGRR